MLIATQILNAVNALHEVGVIHRDIKPENILYTDNNNNGKRDVLKIADFSLDIRMVFVQMHGKNY